MLPQPWPSGTLALVVHAPWHFLYFFPLPHGHGSLRPTLSPARVGGDDAAVKTIRREEPKVGRNDPCPCGSGKKYKQCHGRLA